MSDPPVRARWRGNIALMLYATVVSVGSAELVLRVLGLGFPSVGQVDPVRGWSLRPNAVAFKDLEGGALVRINKDGYRGPLVPRSKPPDTYRIAVLGDSFTLGAHVDEDETFTAVMERSLARCSGLPGRVEAINFGVTGYGTAQQLLTFRHQAFHYRPDAVLLAMFTGNDIENNHRALARDPLAPYFLLDGDQLVLDESFRDSRHYQLKHVTYEVLRLSFLAQVVKRNYTLMSAMSLEPPTLERALRQETRAALYTEPGEPVWREAWAVTEALVARLASEVRDAGARFAVTTLSNGIQVVPDPAVRTELLERFGIADPWYPDDRIQRFTREREIPAIALAPRLYDRVRLDGVHLHGFANTLLGVGHWNEDGHLRAGELLAADLCAILVEPPKR